MAREYTNQNLPAFRTHELHALYPSQGPELHVTALNTDEHKITCELAWHQLVNAEMIAVTSVMRKNTRWSGMNVNGLHMGNLGLSMGLRNRRQRGDTMDAANEGKSLLNIFSDLRKHMENLEDAQSIDASELLNPFLEVIKFGNTTGPIVETALGSVEKFLRYGILGLHSPNIAIAMNALSSAATHCKFEASDPASDELVLLKMLQVLQTALTGECGQVLSNEAVCEMIETGLSMCCQMRLSEMLRRSAEQVMTSMIISIFERMKFIDEDWQVVDTPTEGDVDIPHVILPPSPTTITTEQKDVHVETPEADTQISSPSKDTETQEGNESQVDNDTGGGDAASLAAYGLPAIRELLRVLISLLNPHEHKHTDSMRHIALNLLTVAFEVGGRSIGRFESLRNLVIDDLCKFLFQLAKTNSVSLLSLSLRTIATVFETIRPHLKLQQELFLFFLIERLSPPYMHPASRNISIDIDKDGKIAFISNNKDASDESITTLMEGRSGSPNIFLGKSTDSNAKGYTEQPQISREIRELLLECLLQCTYAPTFMVDLWYNYDCDLSCGDLFEELIQFLSKNSFPHSQIYSGFNSHALCLNALLTFIEHMVSRVNKTDSGDENDELVVCSQTLSDSLDFLHLYRQGLISSEELLRRKATKRIILKGSYMFNENAEQGIAFLREQGIIKPDNLGDDMTSIALFLKNTQQLDKKQLGEYLVKPRNIKLLQIFMEQFDFAEKRLDEALRLVLETFRLPGESQQIERVTLKFSEAYFETKPAEIVDSEAAQVLAYSIIMLNTDQHHHQVRRRMTLDDYKRNVRGLNGGQDFPYDYLKDIYEAIQLNEIIIPEEHEGSLGFNHAWKQLLHRTESSNPFVMCDTSAYDSSVFELAWKPVLAAITYAFNTAQDDATLQKAITGFHQCAMLSSHFKLYEVFDSVIVTLASMTGFLEEDEKSDSLADPIVDVAGQKYVVSNLAIRFGCNYKAQLAAVVVFKIVLQHGNSLRNGWEKILKIIRNLFTNSLLPTSLLQVEDFLSGTTSIPLKAQSPTIVKQQARRDGSLLSTLSSYLLTPYSNDDSYRSDPTMEEIESTMCAYDCIAVCRLEELFAEISSLDDDAMKSLMSALTKVGYDSSKIDTSSDSPIPYDPTTILFLECMTSVVLRNVDRIDILWPFVTDYIFTILEHADKQSVFVVERSVVGLLRLCIRIAPKEEMHDEILKSLTLLRGFPPTVTQAVAEQMMAGIFNLSSAMKLSAEQGQGENDSDIVKTILDIKKQVGSSI